MIEVETCIGPAQWASYLVNGDASGFDYYNTPTDNAGDRDQAACDAWVEYLARDGWYVVSAEGESYFDDRYIFGVGLFAGDVIEYTLHRRAP